MAQSNLYTCLKGTIVVAFLIFFHAAGAQKTVKAFGLEAYPDLDALVNAKEKQLGGNAVIMVWSDTLKYKRELGMFTSRTPAPIASASKWLTAALVMVLVQEGKISLDDKVSDFIPEFAKYGKNYITIRHCLSHFTGIQESGAKKIFNRNKFASLEEEVNEIASHEIQTNPGTEFRYSGVGLNIAGRILEIVTKKKFDMLAQQKLFRPLGMRNTSFSNPDGSPPDPSGGARSTADDYMKFLVMLLNNGKHNGVQILSEESIREMRTIRTSPELIKYAPRSADGFSYALGAWGIAEKGEEATVLASPGLFGTWPLVDWEKGYAYIVFVKSLLGEQKKELYMLMKDAIDTDHK
jgi:CubicO group peptidase (beta-lactamase class C family)